MNFWDLILGCASKHIPHRALGVERAGGGGGEGMGLDGASPFGVSLY